MQVHKPRDSILSLFDPLVAPGTPPRNTGSPDSTSSDKENDSPNNKQPGETTIFFNRIYKENPVYEAKSPKGKLIDFGEASFVSCGDEGTRGEDGAMSEDEDASMSPFFERRPLADLEIEKTVPSTSTFPDVPPIIPTLCQPSWSESSTTLSTLTSNPSSATTLADVINEINLSAMTLADKENQPVTDKLSCPDITVCPPEVEPAPSIPQVEEILNSPPDQSYLSPVSSGATRRTSNCISPNDPRRASVDLQSAFKLQMQSSDMSFDLLNDKISFLNPAGLGCSLAEADANDDTFDLAKEQLQMEEIASRYMRSTAINVDEDTFDFVKEQQRMEAVLRKYVPINEESLPSVMPDVPRVKDFSQYLFRSVWCMHTDQHLLIVFSSPQARTIYRAYFGLDEAPGQTPRV